MFLIGSHKMKIPVLMLLSFSLIFFFSSVLEAEDHKTGDLAKLANTMDRFAAEFRRQAEVFSQDAKQAPANVSAQLQILVQHLNDGASVREQIAKAARANNPEAVDNLFNLIAPGMEKIKQIKEGLKSTGYVEKMKLEKKAAKSKDSANQEKIQEIHISTPEQFDAWLSQSTAGKSLK
jgi:hypothetical protein